MVGVRDVHEDVGSTDGESGAPHQSCPFPSGLGPTTRLGLPSWGNGKQAEGMP